MTSQSNQNRSAKKTGKDDVQSYTKFLAGQYRSQVKNESIPTVTAMLSTDAANKSQYFRDQIRISNSQPLTILELGDELTPPPVSTDDISMTTTESRKRKLSPDAEAPPSKRLKTNNGNSNKMEVDKDGNDSEADEFAELMPDLDTLDAGLSTAEQHALNKAGGASAGAAKSATISKPKPLSKEYKDDKDFQDLLAPQISKANDFFDPITHSAINLETETQMDMIHWKSCEDKLEISASDIEREQISSVNLHRLNTVLSQHAHKYQMTVDTDSVPFVVALALQTHIKNTLQNVAKWTDKRLDKDRYSSHNEVCSQAQLWIDSVNEAMDKTEEKQESDETRNSLMAEKEDLDFKNITSILTPDEQRRRAHLHKIISEANSAAAKSSAAAQKSGDRSSVAMRAIGGDFSFDFSKKKKKKSDTDKSGSTRKADDKKAVVKIVDIVNYADSDRLFSQWHLKSLPKLHLLQK